MKLNNDSIPHLKAVAEINLSSLLLKTYINEDFDNLEKLIKDFFKKDLPPIFKIKSYDIYQEIINIEWNKIQYVFLKSLKNLNKDNLLSRAKLDANLLINMPTQILLTINKIYQNKSTFKSDTEEEGYLIGLILLLPETSLIDAKETIYDNKKIINLKEKDLEGKTLPIAGSKKKFKEYAKKIEENKNSIDNLKAIDKAFNDEVLALNRLSVIAKKIFFNDMWICSFLANSRESHKQASGSKRNSQGYFIVGGERFRFCGDWATASIGNVVNCRCYIINNY